MKDTVAKLKAYVEKQMALDPYEYLDGDDAKKLLALAEVAKLYRDEFDPTYPERDAPKLRAALRALEAE